VVIECAHNFGSHKKRPFFKVFFSYMCNYEASIKKKKKKNLNLNFIFFFWGEKTYFLALNRTVVLRTKFRSKIVLIRQNRTSWQVCPCILWSASYVLYSTR
jgi:hypothetical protein